MPSTTSQLYILIKPGPFRLLFFLHMALLGSGLSGRQPVRSRLFAPLKSHSAADAFLRVRKGGQAGEIKHCVRLVEA